MGVLRRRVSTRACVRLSVLPGRLRLTGLLPVGLLLVLSLGATNTRAADKQLLRPPVVAAAQIQAIVDGLRAQLTIPHTVTVALVPKNPLMASVEPAKEGDGFVISIEEAFAARLTADELKGVLAHELGHVWIFTHHPYLQTEAQANRVAMRLVTRETLENVYDKVWQDGAKGDVVRFFGAPQPSAAQ